MDINQARKLGEELGRVEDAHAFLLRQCREVGASDADIISAAEAYVTTIHSRNAAFDAAGGVELGERASGVVTSVPDAEWLPGELERLLNDGQLDAPIAARVERALGEGKSTGSSSA